MASAALKLGLNASAALSFGNFVLGFSHEPSSTDFEFSGTRKRRLCLLHGSPIPLSESVAALRRLVAA